MSITPGTVLVVDDEHDLCRVIAEALEEDGHEVETVADAETGLECLSNNISANLLIRIFIFFTLQRSRCI